MLIFHRLIVSLKLPTPLSMNSNSVWNSCGRRFGVGKGSLSSVIDREELSFLMYFSEFVETISFAQLWSIRLALEAICLVWRQLSNS